AGGRTGTGAAGPDAVGCHVLVHLHRIRAGLAWAVPTGNRVELRWLWTEPRCRGCGVADTAVAAVVEWADVHRPGVPVTVAAEACDARAVRLFRRHGVEVTSFDTEQRWGYLESAPAVGRTARLSVPNRSTVPPRPAVLGPASSVPVQTRRG